MAKRLDVCVLLDFYGDFLTDRQRLFSELYFDRDYSLAEIAEQESVSRQAVRDALIRGEAVLRDFEEKLGLCRKYGEQRELLRRLDEAAGRMSEDNGRLIREITAQIADIWGE